MAHKKIRIEVLHEGAHWISCEYMARLVESVAKDYGESVQWEKVITKDLSGAMRFLELTKHLGRPAPVPSIFIRGELVFEVTPSSEELRGFLDHLISEKE